MMNTTGAGNASETDTSFAVRDTAERSGNRTKSAIKTMFKAVMDVCARRDTDTPKPEAKRRGKGESGSPIIRQQHRHTGTPSSRGRYAGLRSKVSKAVKIRRKFTRAATGATEPDACTEASIHSCNMLDWMNLWQANAEAQGDVNHEWNTPPHGPQL